MRICAACWVSSRCVRGDPRKGCGIERRYLVLAPGRADGLDDAGLYRAGDFAGTAAPMRVYEERATDLAFAAAVDLDDDLAAITHLVLVSCTGFAAPGVDLALIERLALSSGIERTIVGFMGCHAAINALRLARHIVRSEPEARVLVICLELCTLHLQETADLEQVLSFLIFADGCAAALVSRKPRGLALGGSTTTIAAAAADQITWRIGSQGFDMKLAGSVPGSIGAVLPGPPAGHAAGSSRGPSGPLGGPPGRAERARCGRARASPRAGGARRLARRAAPLR